MKEWLTTREIAEAGLPHVPATVKGVLDLAEREGWNADGLMARKRAGRGGGMEYHVSLLPKVARVAYHARHVVATPTAALVAANDTPIVLPKAKASSGRAALERDARLAIVALFERFLKGTGLRQAQALRIFEDDFNMRRLSVDAWILDVVSHLGRGTLKRWMAGKKVGREIGVDRSLARKGTGVLDVAEGGEVRLFMLALIAHQPHLSGDQVRTQVRGRFGDRLKVSSKAGEKLVPVPPVRAFQRTLASLKGTEAVVLTKLTNPDQFRSTLKLRGTGTMRHVVEPNSHWQIDASPVDALCNDGRHTVYVCIDVATRRMILFISRTANSTAVGLLLRKAIMEWGVPVEIKTDNGSDFVAKSTKRLLDSLGVELKLSQPFNPQEKAFVERQIGTFQRDAVTLIPGFIGHSVADRKAIESRKAFAQRLGEDDANTFMVQCSSVEMQAHFDCWTTLRHQHRAHAGLKGRTPFQVAAEADHTIRRVDERALDMLLAPIADGNGTRKVQATGIRVGGFHYLNGTVLPGTTVFVRHDPADKGRIHLFDSEDGAYVGEAICAELAGISPADFVKAQKELQAEILREKSQEIERRRRELRNGPALIDRAREVWFRDQPNVAVFPKRTEVHTTPAIEAALDAFEARTENRPHRQDDERVAEAQRRLVAEMDAEDAAEIHRQASAVIAERAAEVEAERVGHLPATVIPLPESPKARYRRAVLLERAIARHEPVPAADAMWLERYRNSTEYRAQQHMHDGFGDEYLAL